MSEEMLRGWKNTHAATDRRVFLRLELIGGIHVGWKSRGLAAVLILFAFLFVDAAFNEAQALRPRGAWSASTTYALDDLVALRGSTWRSKHASNLNKLPGSTSPSTATDWELFAAGFNPLGPWSQSKTYHRNDLVVFGSNFRALRTSVNAVPGGAPQDWQLFVPKGATGATGPQGPQGVPDAGQFDRNQ